MARTPEQNNAIITGSIPRQLLLFFFPIWLGTMFQQLYNTVDTLIVGNFVGTQALAAVGATSSFVQLLVGLFVGLCSGAGVIIAQSFGAGDHDEVNRQVHTALALAIAGGAALTVIGLLISRPVLRLMQTPDEIVGMASEYLQIYFLGMIPQMIYNMGTNILRAVGDSKRPLYFLIVASIVNIVLDIVLVAVIPLGVAGAALTVIGLLISRLVLRLMQTPDEIVGMASEYLQIYFLGMIPQMIYNMGTNILRAVGDSKRPLYFLIVASIVNIVLDIVLVAVIPLGVAGAAIATVASQVVSAVLTVRCIHGSQGMPWHLQLKNIRIERSVLLAICRIGLPGAAQSALYSISNMTIQSAINGFGTVAVAAWSVYGKIDFLFWMTVSSFGIAVTTFAGQNFGARQYDRVRRGTMTCLAMTAGTTLCISLALYPLAQLLFRLFSSDDAVVAQGVQMMHYLVPVYMTYICIEIFSGALRGCGDVRVPTIITVFAVCIMRIVWLAVALPFKHELSVVEFSYPLTWITATVLFAIYYTKGGWMQRCIAAQNAKTQG